MSKYSFEARRRVKDGEAAIRKMDRFRWKYKNSLMLVTGAIAAYVALGSPVVDDFVSGLGYYGYAWSVLFGFLHSFSMTIVPATALLYKLGRGLNPMLIALVASAGAAIGDYFVYIFVRNELLAELQTIGEEVGWHVSSRARSLGISGYGRLFYGVFPFANLLLSENMRVRMFKVAKSRVWRPLFIAAASLIIMLPLPNEIGVTMLGLLDFEPKKFIAYVYVISFIGILGVALLGAG